MNQKVLIPPEWWETTTHGDNDIAMSANDRIIHLFLMSICDRDGVTSVSTQTISNFLGIPRRVAHMSVLYLSDAGYLSLYKDDDGSYWAWLVHAPEMVAGRGTAARKRDLSLPSPSREDVMATLRRLWGREPTHQEAKSVCPRAWGKVRPTRSTGSNSQDLLKIWEEWRKRQNRPNACVLGEAVKTLINRALKNATADQITTLIEYAYQADEPGPRFWRGENDRKRKYLGLDNLLVVSKLPGRIQSAMEWKDSQENGDVMEDGTCLGPMAKFRNPNGPYQQQGPKGTKTSPNPRPKRLTRQCRQMVELFILRQDQGVQTRELAAIALKYSARISELRGHGADIVCLTNAKNGDNTYAMMNWSTWNDPEQTPANEEGSDNGLD